MKRNDFSFGYPLAISWLLLSAGCDISRTPPPEKFDIEIVESLSYGPVTEHFDEGGQVMVEISAAWIDDQWAVVRGVFKPASAGYHLYSTDLPRKGLEGIGRPTSIDPGRSVRRSGKVAANQSAKMLESFGKSYPVYPDGPVTLYRLVMPENDEITVKLTYMACSAEFCLQPVEGAEVSVMLPLSG
jgi:hypothetical protein